MVSHVPGPPNVVSIVRGPGVESSANLRLNFERPALDGRGKVVKLIT